MTDDDKALVRELRTHQLDSTMAHEAADRIEALSAENERLRNELALTEKALVKADEVVKHTIRLANLYERAALGETK